MQSKIRDKLVKETGENEEEFEIRFQAFMEKNKKVIELMFEFLEINNIDTGQGVWAMSEIVTRYIITGTEKKEGVDAFFELWKKKADAMWEAVKG